MIQIKPGTFGPVPRVVIGTMAPDSMQFVVLTIYVQFGTGDGDAYKGVPKHRHPHISVTNVRELLRLYAG